MQKYVLVPFEDYTKQKREVQRLKDQSINTGNNTLSIVQPSTSQTTTKNVDQKRDTNIADTDLVYAPETLPEADNNDIESLPGIGTY